MQNILENFVQQCIMENGVVEKTVKIIKILLIIKQKPITKPAKKNYQRESREIVNIWKTFEIENMRYYHDLYLIWDILLLSDVFEQFQN